MEVMQNLELVIWNLGSGDAPAISTTRTALTDAGLSSSHAEDMPLSTAFRRACDQVRDKTKLVRLFTPTGNKDLHVQIDRQSVDGSELQNSRIGVYRCHDTMVIRGVGYDYDQEMQDTLNNHLVDSRLGYEWGDISKIIQNIITKDGLGAYSPRKAGGVYFVPVAPEKADMLDRIERFSNAVGIRFLRYSVPDTASQRAEIMDAVSAGIEQEIVAHEEAVNDYTEPPARALEQRGAAIGSTKVLIGRLRHLLNGHDRDMVMRLEVLESRMRELSEARPTISHTPGARRIALV